MTNQLTLVSGRTIEAGQEITVLDPAVDQRRRFRLMRVEPNGDVTAWGPVDPGGLTPNGQTRSFKPEQVEDVKHRKPRSRSLREVTESAETPTETAETYSVPADGGRPAYLVHTDGRVVIVNTDTYRAPDGTWYRGDTPFTPSRNSAAGRVDRHVKTAVMS
jgi:hypothetical protein